MWRTMGESGPTIVINDLTIITIGSSLFSSFLIEAARGLGIRIYNVRSIEHFALIVAVGSRASVRQSFQSWLRSSIQNVLCTRSFPSVNLTFTTEYPLGVIVHRLWSIIMKRPWRTRNKRSCAITSYRFIAEPRRCVRFAKANGLKIRSIIDRRRSREILFIV